MGRTMLPCPMPNTRAVLFRLPPPDELPHGELVEVVDTRDRPLAVMPLSAVHSQCLFHRSVLTLIYDAHGKVYLQQRSPAKTLYPGRWDISSTGHVRAGESRHAAALRELNEELGLRVTRLKRLANLPASAETGWEFVTLFNAGCVRDEPRPNPSELAGGYFYDAEELACLATHFRDKMTPGLLWFFKRGYIFP